MSLQPAAKSNPLVRVVMSDGGDLDCCYGNDLFVLIDRVGSLMMNLLGNTTHAPGTSSDGKKYTFGNQNNPIEVEFSPVRIVKLQPDLLITPGQQGAVQKKDSKPAVVKAFDVTVVQKNIPDSNPILTARVTKNAETNKVTINVSSQFNDPLAILKAYNAHWDALSYQERCRINNSLGGLGTGC